MREETLRSQLLVQGESAHLIGHLFAHLMEFQTSTYESWLRGDDLKQPMHAHDVNDVQVQCQLPKTNKQCIYHVANRTERNLSNRFITSYTKLQLYPPRQDRIISEFGA